MNAERRVRRVRGVRGIVVASGLALACSRAPGPTGTDATSTLGTLTINVTGIAKGAPTGGSASVTRTDIDGQPTLSLGISNQGPAGSSVVVTVAMGTYSISYSPPSGYTLPEGAARVQTVDVKAGRVSAWVNFNVEFRGTVGTPTGFLGVEAQFLSAPYPANGGSASIVRTDGQSPLTLDIPDEYSEGYYAVAEVPLGTYTITYSPPSGYKVPPSYASVQTAVVSDSRFTVWVTFSAIYAPASRASYDRSWSGITSPAAPVISVVAVAPSVAAADRNAGRRGGRRTSDP
jgi:hypothetical protein